MADFKLKMLGTELVMFLSIMAIGLWVSRLIMISAGPPVTLQVTEALSSFLIAFVIAIAMILLALRFLRGPVSFGIFFSVLIFIGSQIVFGAFLPLLWSIAAAAAIAGLRLAWPNVLTHNLAMFLTIAGVSAQLGLILPVAAVVIILIALSFYDYWAVFKSKYMITWFKGMLKVGAPFAIVVPEKPQAIMMGIHRISKQKLKEKDRKVIMLGTGDIAFPTVFAVSAFAAYQSGFAVFAIVAGTVVGIFVNHYLLTQKFRAIPALPAIAAFSIIGFAIAYLLALV
jgi:presenilin-like A22 family membrane protease